jgi:hypothetical protein
VTERFATATNIWQGRMLNLAPKDLTSFEEYYSRRRAGGFVQPGVCAAPAADRRALILSPRKRLLVSKMITELGVMLLARRGWKIPLDELSFLGPLGLAPSDSGVAFNSSQVRFDLARIQVPGGIEEPSDPMDEVWERAATWLEARGSEVFDLLRSRGFVMEVLISFWMTQDQMEWTLPPRLLLQLGRCGLPCHIISND